MEGDVGDWFEVVDGDVALVVNGFDGNDFGNESGGIVGLVFKSEGLNEGFVRFSDNFEDWGRDREVVVGGLDRKGEGKYDGKEENNQHGLSIPRGSCIGYEPIHG